MKLLEYQGKELFRRVGIPVPRGTLVVEPRDAATFVAEHGGAWVVKSQVAMGGRGKAGGIRFSDSPEAAEDEARSLIGSRLASVQNPAGEDVRSVLVEERLAVASEAYLSIAIDRDRKRPVALASARGGTDIEELAAREPAAIARYWIDPAIGARAFVARRLAHDASLPLAFRAALPRVLAAAYELFMTYGAHLVEINPLIVTASGDVVAGDAKVELDDNGLFRHPDVAAWREAGPPDEDRIAAVAIGLAESNYARLDGDIGVIANGAGLGMSTMDAIGIAGGAAANFLDIGGGARDELVARSYRLVTDDVRVRAVFVNIFGGITRGDQVARGIVAASTAPGVRRVPLVVRLTGTNAREGRAILAEAGIEPVETMDAGAARAVALAEESRVPIFLDKNARVVVQGATGREGAFHMQRMCDYGTTVVAGVSPGKGGTTSCGVRVFDTVAEAVATTGATHTVVFVPPAAAADALYEAYDAGISLAICITEGIPVHDMLRVVATTAPMRIVGPNCPGIVSPGLALAGIMPGDIFSPGEVGVISRSGTLTYEIVDALTKAGLGQSTCVGIGGDPIVGTTFVDCLRAFSRDPATTSVVVCGEIGGSDEESAATFIAEHLPQLPIVAFIGGRSAPAGKRLGHAGAIISGSFGTPESKLAAFARAGVPVADRPSDIPRLLRERITARTALA